MSQKVKHTIKRARDELCLTVKEFSKLLGVSAPSITNWENGFGDGPSRTIIRKITQKLIDNGVKVTYADFLD